MRASYAVVAATLSVLIVGVALVTAQAGSPPPPDPAVQDPATLLNDSPPPWQRRAEPGPVIGEGAAVAVAVRAGGYAAATVESVTLETYDAARAQTRGGNNLSLGPDRQVYVVVLGGSFTFRRHPAGVDDVSTSRVYVLIHAITGESIAAGEMP